MKTCHKLLLVIALAFFGSSAIAQTSKSLTDDGIALFDKGDYNGALEKYRQALKLDTGNLQADFELAYTLETTGKGMDGIPYLEKILRSNDSKYETYELLGTIYDDNGQPDKAIDNYKKGIKEKPNFERLHFNLSVTYERLKMYKDAEAEAIEAIKLDPKHASPHRIYGLALYNQGKQSLAVLPLCNFLFLQPKSNLAKPVYDLIDSIFSREGSKNIVLTTNDFQGKDISPLALSKIAANLAVTTKDSLMNRGNIKPVDQMDVQLKMLFTFMGNISKKMPADKDFFWKYYADYFSKLAESDNMLTFTHYITLSIFTDDDQVWFKEHDASVKDFSKWISDTKRDL